MKHHFVLDENIIVLAQKREDDRGEPDPTSLEVIRSIISNCHSLVFSDEIWGRYSRQIRALERQRVPLVPRVMAIIKSLLVDASKDTRVVGGPQLPQIEALNGLEGVDEGDQDFVRAAAAVPGSILVTTDMPLTNALERAGIDKEYGFIVRTPAAALQLAGPQPG